MADRKQYRGPVGPLTDVTKWRLRCERGRQTWEYDELGESGREQNFIEKHALGMDTVSRCVGIDLGSCQCIITIMFTFESKFMFGSITPAVI